MIVVVVVIVADTGIVITSLIDALLAIGAGIGIGIVKSENKLLNFSPFR